jgi:hypothetical protein
MNFPRYAYPMNFLIGFVRDVLIHRQRSFHGDAQTCIAALEPPLRILGAEHIPLTGPCLLTINHYHRPGFAAQWLALGISAVVPAEIHWIMTAEWTAPGKWYGLVKRLASRCLLGRLARTYGFTSMPPMPPRPRDVEARARAVRAVLAFVKTASNPIIGLAPEGGDQPGGRLSQPAPGSGRFALRLAGLGLSPVPVGAYEQDGALCLHFGPSYEFNLPAGISAAEKERQAATIMMENIACLLPQHLRGQFG